MIFNISSKDNKTNNFSKDRDNLKKYMGVSSHTDLSQDHFNFLLNYNFTKKANASLAGHIKTSYFYNDWPKDFEEYLINKFKNDNTLMSEAKELKLLNDNTSLCLDILWINKQKKHEFNPVHNHTGIFSFIIPLQIPYDLNEEDRNVFGGLNSSISTSRLTFLKIKNNSIIYELVNMDQSYIGKLLMFSATLKHLVYPFYTSDEYRITVAGNIIAKD